MHDAVIVGAGIAGLTAAWELGRRGVSARVLEAGARPGGVIVTEHTRGFVIDGGPDAILVQKPAAVDLCRELGIADRLVSTLAPRTAYVLRSGALVALPEASFLGLPTGLAPLVATQLFSWPGKVRMALELVRPPRRDAGDESIGAFMRRRFGDEAVRYLAEPLLAGIHAGDVDALSVHALFPRLVEAERSHGSVLRSLLGTRRPASTQGAFASFPGGISELVTALVHALGESAITCNARVVRAAGTGPFTLTLSSGDTLTTRLVIAATPPWAASPLLTAIDPALATLCGAIPYASSATVAFALRREQVRHHLQGTGFVVPRTEGRALMAGTWVSSKWAGRAPDGHVLLRGFLGGATHPSVLERTDEELAAQAYGDLSAILGVTGKPLLTRVFRWPRATPQYLVGHLDRVRQIDDRLRQIPGLFLTGSGYRGTGIPDCIADARATAAAAAAFLGVRPP